MGTAEESLLGGRERGPYCSGQSSATVLLGHTVTGTEDAKARWVELHLFEEVVERKEVKDHVVLQITYDAVPTNLTLAIRIRVLLRD